MMIKIWDDSETACLELNNQISNSYSYFHDEFYSPMIKYFLMDYLTLNSQYFHKHIMFSFGGSLVIVLGDTCQDPPLILDFVKKIDFEIEKAARVLITFPQSPQN